MTLKCSKAGHTIRSPGDVDQNGHCLQCAEEKMNSFPRQAREIESLTSQLSASRKLSDSLVVAVERQRTELMALREKVLLLEQRPTREKYDALVEERDKWEDTANYFSTAVEIAKEQSSHYKEKYRRVTDRRSVDSQMREAQRALTPCDCPMCEARGM